MPIDTTTIVVAISGWVTWFAKEIIASLIKRADARSGTHGYIPIRWGAFGKFKTTDGGTSHIQLRHFPGCRGENLECSSASIEFEGELFNDTGEQCIYQQKSLELWGVEGLRLKWKKPNISIDREPDGRRKKRHWWDCRALPRYNSNSCANVNSSRLQGAYRRPRSDIYWICRSS